MNSAATFFNEEERARIIAAVEAAERRTRGEIVPLVIDAAYDYPRAEIQGGGFLTLALAANLSWWLFDGSLWVFLVAFLVGYWPCRLGLRLFPSLLRQLIRPEEINAEVAERAKTEFLDHGLHRTREGTGILIMICLFEHRVQVLADHGIHNAVPPESWQHLADLVTVGIRERRTCDALCEAVELCGDMLAKNFPPRPDDMDELPNLIT